jgi:phosphodiesterase/alkaline phosphatase D-like protein
MERIKFISIVAILSTVLSSNAAMAGQDSLLEIPDVSRDKVICFALYTVHNNIMKMTAQLYPLKKGEDRFVRLQVNNGKWVEIAKASVIEQGWTTHFRVEGWDSTKDTEYRLAHGKKAYYTGLIRKDPVDKEVIVMAAFTGNSVYPGHGGDIPKADIVENLKKIKPDLLFFSGDQVYDHRHHYAYWLKFGRDFGEVIRNTPTVTIPDDHDVGQANLWGAGGKKSNTKAGHDGGYYMPVEYVRQVEEAQTSHLPDPFDPTPVEQDIGVYYTALNIGRISFAIIEDRKFKSGPQGLVPQIGPRPDHIRDADYDPKTVDVPGAVLLGERQLRFLREWGGDWRGVDMKAVLSQTIFCGGAHIHGKVGGRLHADMDSNGWPQKGRNKALAEIRRCFAVHIAGDQHLATIFHHGIDDWEDACYSFCVPSIANFYLRWWDPLEAGQNRQAGMPEYTGRHLDGFGNRITCWAAANPSTEPNGDKLTTRAAGFGVVKFNKRTRQITFECWPRNVDITAPGARQYPGWPKTIRQIDNYGRKAEAYLPTLEFKDATNPVVQVIDESSGEIVYTLRINGTRFAPKVFSRGNYTIRVGRDSLEDEMKDIKTLTPDDSKTIHIKLN